jgi:hypothetical protein
VLEVRNVDGRLHSSARSATRTKGPRSHHCFGKPQGDFPGSAGSPQFHVEKSCICQDLEHLAKQIKDRLERKIEVVRQRQGASPAKCWKSAMSTPAPDHDRNTFHLDPKGQGISQAAKLGPPSPVDRRHRCAARCARSAAISTLIDAATAPTNATRSKCSHGFTGKVQVASEPACPRRRRLIEISIRPRCQRMKVKLSGQ